VCYGNGRVEGKYQMYCEIATDRATALLVLCCLGMVVGVAGIAITAWLEVRRLQQAEMQYKDIP